MDMTNSSGFVEIKSSLNRKIVLYYAKNLDNFENYIDFLAFLKPGLIELLSRIVALIPIKFNLKLEATYHRPNVENSSQNRSFKTMAQPIVVGTDIGLLVDQSFTILLNEEEVYLTKGSGYVLESIDGLLLTVYKYAPTGNTPGVQLPIIHFENNSANNPDNITDNTPNNNNNNNNNFDNTPNDNNNFDNTSNDNSFDDQRVAFNTLVGASYIKLPDPINNKRATINPQNKDHQCFKWAILAKHVTGPNKHRVGNNYYRHENKYNFSGLSFPTPWSQVKTFEKNNPTVSVNVYGVKKITKPNLNYHIFPLKIADDEKADHFDIILFTEGDKSHYIYISTFSRLIRSQITKHGHAVYFCKRCFSSFDDQTLKYKLSGRLALIQHKLICGSHKPILPIMPETDKFLEFDSWKHAQRHPFAIYADFEALLVKANEKRGKNTTIIHKHEPLSYGFVVKPSDDVPIELIEQFNIPTTPVIYRGNKSHEDVAEQFVKNIVEVCRKIEELLKTNVAINMSDDDIRRHNSSKNCNFCKRSFDTTEKVRDHCHLTGKFRQSLCSRCNLDLKQPKFVPCFFHNLSKYDSHFIISRLGFDSHKIKVIPNNEEQFISFSKYISRTFTIRFVDTCKFMASKLSSLAKNLLTQDFSKFRETMKHFDARDIPLVTRKGVYPYEYTDGWDKLDETSLPPKEEFYSSLKEKGIKDSNYDHAKSVWSHFGCQTLGDYSDLYLKVDVLLLADVFENFRDLCMKTYNLDPAFYYTAPGYSFDCMLKYTSVKLQLLTDYDMLLCIENGMYIMIR